MYSDIDIEQAQTIFAAGNCTIFDIRDDRSYQQGRIPGALRFSDTLVRNMRRNGKRNEPVLVYCYHGISSRDIAQMLCDFGFTDVYSLSGGYAAWDAAQNPAPAKTTNNATALSNDVIDWLNEQCLSHENLEQRTENGFTALMQAARYGMAGTVKQLLLAGADIHALNNDANNALWLACYSGDAETIKVLLDGGVNINHQNDSGITCLIYASSTGKGDVVQQLLSAGADAALKNNDGFSALDFAASEQAYRLLRAAAKKREGDRV